MRAYEGSTEGFEKAVDALPLEDSLPSLATQPTTNDFVMGKY